MVRPVAGFLPLRGAPGHRAEHAVIAAFGIRGIGSFYYLAYAMTHAAFRRWMSYGRQWASSWS